jgi:hypothetical protein
VRQEEAAGLAADLQDLEDVAQRQVLEAPFEGAL